MASMALAHVWCARVHLTKQRCATVNAAKSYQIRMKSAKKRNILEYFDDLRRMDT